MSTDDARASRLLAAADAERRAVERALHDGVQQDLVAASVRIQLARRLVVDEPGEAEALLGELARDLREALDGLRALAERVYPGQLEPLGLAEALRAAGLDVDDRWTGRAAAAAEASLFFVCRDLSNGRGRVRLARAAEGLRAELALDAVDEERLTAARDRVEASGGALAVEARDGGVYVSATIPERPSDR